ncbi:NAD(+) diphosphatase [Vibrio sp. RC27]
MLANSDISCAYWCVVSGSDLWLINGELPCGTAQQLSLPKDSAIEVAKYQGLPVYWVNEEDVDVELEMHSLRELICADEDIFLAASKAVQFGHMTQTQRFCSQCGGRTHLNHRETSMQCQDCRTLHYPRIFPCIIVAVRSQDKILLAQHPRHRNGMYTVIAGFVEVGETLEQCVAREVKEETGITVTNIRYFGSQPWAFPSSIMVAFLADYESGTIKPDYSELSDAAWFGAQELPPVAPVGTIARALIDKTLDDIKTIS